MLVTEHMKEHKKLIMDIYKKPLENVMREYSDIWYFNNSEVKNLFIKEEFIELVKKLSRIVINFDGKEVVGIKFSIISKTVLQDASEEKQFAFDRLWKNFTKDYVPYMTEKTKEVYEKISESLLSRENIKEIVEKFFEEYNEEELYISIFLDSEGKKPICNFHINSDYREIVEDSTYSKLIIADYTTPKSLIPDDVAIQYDEVVKCERSVRTGETEDDIIANVLVITFRNGTVLELGFLNI